ncbi:uncharacterized protein IL334_005955 [Kwoniella shivajii]|uniref:Major facilitator superfamily (MFS) profile domain-containing protein n=1 Tax=Kwoniella shivajii TaxID=564305 RepID=A0ABZ1D4X1_9TREE|nr:hypothetical protein IL334_005955 [Kwoniella shivajii]
MSITSPSSPSRLKWLYTEFGLASVVETGPDAWLIMISRSCRMFAYGSNSVFIALFFSALEYSDFRIGLFMTLTLLGDVFLTLGLTMIADNIGRRRTLLLGSTMMVFSGLIFFYFENYWILLLAAVVGVISPSGSDFGPFRAIEESIISQLTNQHNRSNVLSWYVTSSSFGAAIGIEGTGRLVQLMKDRNNWQDVKTYHYVFGLYIIMGLVNIICVSLLSTKTELESAVEVKQDEEQVPLNRIENGEGEELEHEFETEDQQRQEEVKRNDEQSTSKTTSNNNGNSRFQLTQISSSTRSVMYKLWPLLIVDCLADGMVGYSLTSYYMDTKFQLKASTLGDFISISYFLAAISTIFAGPIANRIGLINTMVFTHIPSSAAVLLFPLPSSLTITIVLFFIRTGLNNMDQAPRAAFIAAVVPSSERTAVNGITTLLRTLASTAGPSITGGLAQHDLFWIAFTLAGSLRLAYDFGLWALFVNMKLYQHEGESDG